MFRYLIIASCMLDAACSLAYADPGVPTSPATHEDGRFKAGRARLTGAVSDQWSRDLPLIRKAYLNGTWSELSRLVIAADANLDLAYYYLGRAAEGLGYASAAKIYYVRAKNAPGCLGPFDACHGYSASSDLEPRLTLVTHLEAQAGATSPQQFVTLPSRIWTALSDEQRNVLDNRYVVDVVPDRNYGMIVHVQSVNESTPGSSAGSQLGAAYASAAYVDRAFKGPVQNWNYSATGQLTSAIAGALVGSMLDKPAEKRFHTRYTIKSGSGDMGYLDSYSADPFTHPAGMCVQINPLRPISAETCELTLERALSYHFGLAAATAAARPNDGGTRSAEARLRELKSIFDKGMITKEAFDRKRDEIIQSL